MRAEVDQLLVFCRVVRLGSFTRAAEELSLTQPAVSAQIARLEQRLKVKLIDRLGRRAQPTRAGEMLYSYAEQVERLCNILCEAEQAVDATEEELIGKPNNVYDLCLLEGPVRAAGVQFETFMVDELCLVVARDHPWARRAAEGVDIEELADQTFISHRKGSGMQTTIQREFDRHGVEIVPAMVIDNIEAVKKVVEAGLGVSVLSTLIIRQELERGTLVVVPVRNASFRREFKIATRRGKHIPRPVRAFLAFLKESCPLVGPASP